VAGYHAEFNRIRNMALSALAHHRLSLGAAESSLSHTPVMVAVDAARDIPLDCDPTIRNVPPDYLPYDLVRVDFSRQQGTRVNSSLTSSNPTTSGSNRPSCIVMSFIVPSFPDPGLAVYPVW